MNYNNINPWSSLSMADRSAWMKFYLNNGINKLEEMQATYNKYANGGNTKYPDGGPIGVLNNPTYNPLANLNEEVYPARPLRTVNITTTRPEWQENLNDYDLARLKSGELDVNTAKSIATKRSTGTSQYMNDVNRLATIPNAAVGAIGAVPLAANAIALGSTGLGAVNSFVESVPTLRHIRTGLDAIGTIDGIRNAASNNGIRKTIRLAQDEGASWNTIKSGIGDALDILGVTDVARFGVNRFLRPTFNGEAAVANIKPYGYNNKGISKNSRTKIRQFSDYLSDLRSGNIHQRVDYNNIFPLTAFDGDTKLQSIYNKGREDAFRIYEGLKPKHNFFIKNNNGTWSYNLNNPDLQYSINKSARFLHGDNYDFVTSAGGGVRLKDYPLLLNIKDNNNITRDYGYFEMSDLWDLQPFSRSEDTLKTRLKTGLYDDLFINPIKNTADKVYKKLYNPLFAWDKKISKIAYPLIGEKLNHIRTSFGTKIDKNGLIHTSPIKSKILDSKFIENLSNKIKDFEVGPVIGGKPYLVTTNIPYTRYINFEHTNKNFIPQINRLYGFDTDDLSNFLPKKIILPPNSTYTLFVKPYYSFNLNKDIPGTINIIK